MTEDVTTKEIIHSTIYGQIEVQSDQIYSFHQGIVGFPDIRKFALLPYEDTELFVLQAFNDEISLLLIPASLCSNSVSFSIDENTITQLRINDAESIVVFYVLRFIENETFINLKGPILLVPDQKIGCQYIITDDAVSLRERLVLAGADSC